MVRDCRRAFGCRTMPRTIRCRRCSSTFRTARTTRRPPAMLFATRTWPVTVTPRFVWTCVAAASDQAYPVAAFTLDLVDFFAFELELVISSPAGTKPRSGARLPRANHRLRARSKNARTGSSSCPPIVDVPLDVGRAPCRVLGSPERRSVARPTCTAFAPGRERKATVGRPPLLRACRRISPRRAGRRSIWRRFAQVQRPPAPLPNAVGSTHRYQRTPDGCKFAQRPMDVRSEMVVTVPPADALSP
jgi:hypothetical protein